MTLTVRSAELCGNQTSAGPCQSREVRVHPRGHAWCPGCGRKREGFNKYNSACPSCRAPVTVSFWEEKHDEPMSDSEGTCACHWTDAQWDEVLNTAVAFENGRPDPMQHMMEFDDED